MRDKKKVTCQPFGTVPTAFRLQPITKGMLKSLLRRYKGGKAMPGELVYDYLDKTAATVTQPELVMIVNLKIMGLMKDSGCGSQPQKKD